MNSLTLQELGIDSNISKFTETIDDLRKQTPGMVIGESLHNFSFSINGGKSQFYEKGSGRILSLYIYQTMELNSRSKKKQLVPSYPPFKIRYKPYTGQDLNGKKLLVWRTGGIGDLLFIQPNLKWLKNKYDCEIYFSCSPIYYPLLNHWKDCFDHLVEFPVDAKYLDVCDYHVTFEGVIERCKEAEKTNAYELFSRWMGTKVPKKDLRPTLITVSEFDNKVFEILQDNNIKPNEFITFQIRASSPIRTPSSEVWRNLMIKLLDDGHKIIITDSPRVSDKISLFIKINIPKKYHDRVFNFSPYSKTLDMSISLINFSKLVVAPDSSMVHISEGIGTPVLGIYGAFDPKLRLSTYKYADSIEPLGGDNNICDSGGKHCFTHGHIPCKWTVPGKCVPCYDHLDYDLAYEKMCKLMNLKI